MPEPSLDGSFEKCKRALEHLETFKAETRAWLQVQPYRIVGKFERETNEYVFHVGLPAAPVRFGVVAGEIIHSLRSALEHLVGQLVLANKQPLRTGPNGNGFPVLKEPPSEGFDKRTKGKLRGVCAEARAVVERVQPYRRKNDPRTDPLLILDQLWIEDKHRLLIGTRGSMILLDVDSTRFEPNCDAGAIGIEKYMPFAGHEDGAEIARLTLAPKGADPYVYMDAHVTVEIALRGGAPAIETLQLLSEDVIRVLKRFERFF